MVLGVCVGTLSPLKSSLTGLTSHLKVVNMRARCVEVTLARTRRSKEKATSLIRASRSTLLSAISWTVAILHGQRETMFPIPTGKEVTSRDLGFDPAESCGW